MPEVKLPEVKLPEVKLPELPELPSLPTAKDAKDLYRNMKLPRVRLEYDNFGVPCGEYFGLEEGKSLIPTMKWAMGEHGFEEQDEEIMRELARNLDLDRLREMFVRYAGADERMDEDEFKKFVRILHMTDEHAHMFWRFCDINKDGHIDTDEFLFGLERMTCARAWLRFCPTCDYENECAYCIQISRECVQCNRSLWCPPHWQEHPGRCHKVRSAEAAEAKAAKARADAAAEAPAADAAPAEAEEQHVESQGIENLAHHLARH